MALDTTAFWSVTINNYDEKDLAIIRNGYPDYCREIVHTLEKGEKTGTPHIQAWVKLQRQQRVSFIRKLFPGGHYRALKAEEYIENTKRYCQKLDDTAQSPAIHLFHDPLHTIESVVKQVALEIYKDLSHEEYSNNKLLHYRIIAQDRLVAKDYRYAKIFVSSVYRSMWSDFGPAMYSNIIAEHTHTHTHKDEKFSRQEGITDAHSPLPSLCSEERNEGSSSVWSEDETEVDIPVCSSSVDTDVC